MGRTKTQFVIILEMKTKLFFYLAFATLIGGCKKVNSTYPKVDTDIQFHISYDDMKRGFNNIPNRVKVKSYWFWLNGEVTKESITHELERMKEKGCDGAVVCDAMASGRNAPEVPHGPDMVGKEWIKLLKHAVKDGDGLNVVLSLNLQSGWRQDVPKRKAVYQHKYTIRS